MLTRSVVILTVLNIINSTLHNYFGNLPCLPVGVPGLTAETPSLLTALAPMDLPAKRPLLSAMR